MTSIELRQIAGTPSQANRLTEIVINQLTKEELDGLVGRAIKTYEDTQARVKAQFDVEVTPDRLLRGNPVPPSVSDALFCAFDQITFLREVRAKLSGTE